MELNGCRGSLHSSTRTGIGDVRGAAFYILNFRLLLQQVTRRNTVGGSAVPLARSGRQGSRQGEQRMVDKNVLEGPNAVLSSEVSRANTRRLGGSAGLDVACKP